MILGLYIHIPFCRQKCLYCDFPSYSNMDHLYDDYIAALCREITGQGGSCLSYDVDTVYIGGGTPTLLTAEQLREVMTSVRKHFNITADAEISIEANPGTIDEYKLTCLKKYGINRISFGVQSFSDTLLKCLGRIHSSADAVSSVKIAQKVGFRNINVDLMYGLPNQTMKDLQESIETAARLEVEHLSIYGLKVEEQTPFAEMQARQQLNLPTDIVEEDMYDLATELAHKYGYIRYEISNYAKKGYTCRHNLKYWSYKPYLGVGAAAHSFLGTERLANTANVTEYIQMINKDNSAVKSREKLTISDAKAEFVFLALRTVDGLAYNDFNRYFNDDFLVRYCGVLEGLMQRGLINIDQQRVKLTELGMKYGNQVFFHFI